MKETKDNLSFDLELEEVPVTIAGEKYVLRELDGKQRDKYLDGLGKRLAPAGRDGKAQTVKNFNGLQSSLVCMCLYKDGEDSPVDAHTIQTWPARVVAGLFDAASDLSKLGEEEEDGEDGEGKD